MPTNHLYDTWIQQIRELATKAKELRRFGNFVLLVYGIYQSRSVYLSRIVGKILGKEKLESTIKRFDRFLDNSAIRVRDVNRSYFRQVLCSSALALCLFWIHRNEID